MKGPPMEHRFYGRPSHGAPTLWEAFHGAPILWEALPWSTDSMEQTIDYLKNKLLLAVSEAIHVKQDNLISITSHLLATILQGNTTRDH